MRAERRSDESKRLTPSSLGYKRVPYDTGYLNQLVHPQCVDGSLGLTRNGPHCPIRFISRNPTPRALSDSCVLATHGSIRPMQAKIPQALR